MKSKENRFRRKT